MNKITATTFAAIIAASASSGASARHGSDNVQYARVVSATPIYETIEVNRPTRECWDERVVQRRHGSPAGTLAGGILGGVIGNQFGRGKGRTAMTVAGTLIGATIGHDISHRHKSRDYVTYERRCEAVDRYETQEQVVGYHVRYRYKGDVYMTRTDEHPGKHIPIEVSVKPANYY